MSLIKASQAFAKTHDRNFVRADDVQAIMPAVVNHRLVIKKSQTQLSAAELLMNEVEVPV